MPHDTEEWCKIWRKVYLLFQIWQGFGKFWSEYSKVSNICTFIGPFCTNYITFYLNTFRGVIFHYTEESCNIWRKADLWFEKWYEEFGKIFTKTLENVEIGTLMGSLYPKGMSWKFSEELYVIALGNDETPDKELTCYFKIDKRNLMNFDPSV